MEITTPPLMLLCLAAAAGACGQGSCTLVPSPANAKYCASAMGPSTCACMPNCQMGRRKRSTTFSSSNCPQTPGFTLLVEEIGPAFLSSVLNDLAGLEGYYPELMSVLNSTYLTPLEMLQSLAGWGYAGAPNAAVAQAWQKAQGMMLETFDVANISPLDLFRNTCGDPFIEYVVCQCDSSGNNLFILDKFSQSFNLGCDDPVCNCRGSTNMVFHLSEVFFDFIDCV